MAAGVSRAWFNRAAKPMLLVATMSLILPLSVVDALLGWRTGSTVRVMQNLSIPAWANLTVILWLIAERFQSTKPPPHHEDREPAADQAAAMAPVG